MKLFVVDGRPAGGQTGFITMRKTAMRGAPVATVPQTVQRRDRVSYSA
jgi:hypothetical protein